MENKNEINELREVIKTIKLPDDTIKAINDMNVALAEYLLSVTPALEELSKGINEQMISIYNNLQGYDFSKIYKGILNLNISALAQDKYEEVLYRTKWLPYLDDECKYYLSSKLVSVSVSKKSDKSKEKLTNEIMFSYFNKSRIKEMKRNWNRAELPYHLKKIIKQAIDAYLDSKYALTLSSLVFAWEAIMDEKLSITGKRRGKKQREKFSIFISMNNYSVRTDDYVEHYILYGCEGPEQSIDDVPGRNAIAHSYFKKYPSKKAALNAIIFTNMLINSRYKTS